MNRADLHHSAWVLLSPQSWSFCLRDHLTHTMMRHARTHTARRSPPPQPTPLARAAFTLQLTLPCDVLNCQLGQLPGHRCDCVGSAHQKFHTCLSPCTPAPCHHAHTPASPGEGAPQPSSCWVLHLSNILCAVATIIASSLLSSCLLQPCSSDACRRPVHGWSVRCFRGYAPCVALCPPQVLLLVCHVSVTARSVSR